MSTTPKLAAGQPFPSITVTGLEGQRLTLGSPGDDHDWQMVVVYRGRHCPKCTQYLTALNDYVERLDQIGIDLIAVSADSLDQLNSHLDEISPQFQIAFGLDLGQMQSLGLYVSIPRSQAETDHDFPEPGLFIVNHDGVLQVVELSNNPFVRADLLTLVSGLEWIRKPDNDYPIRGTRAY